MKGLGELPVGLFIMILGLALTSGMVTVSNVGAGEAVKPVSDLSKIVETKTQNQVFHNNYLITAAELSFQNGSDKVLKREGELPWQSSEFDGYDPSYDFSCAPGDWSCLLAQSYGTSRTDRFVAAIEDHTNSSFQRYAFELDGRCEVVNGDFEATVRQYNDEIYSNVNSADFSATVNCENNNVKTQHEYPSYYVSIKPEDNRFYELFKDTNNYFHDLFDKWDSDVDQTYTKTSDTKRCESASKSMKENAESNAVSAANSDVRTAWNEVNDDYPQYDGFIINRNKLRNYVIDSNVGDKTYDANHYGELSTGEKNVGGDCPNPCGGEDEPSCKDYYRGESTLTVKEARVNRTITDAKFKVPLPDGWDNLRFPVEPYVHDLEEY